jgi:uncharacterized membrane protein YkvA (DUF1232 family)
MDITMDVLQKSIGKIAREYAKDTQKTERVLRDATEKAERLDKPGKSIELYENLRLLIGIVKDWSNGSYYKHVSRGSIISIMIGLIYFTSPQELLSEVSHIGFVDEGMILGLVVEEVNEDIEKYRIWKNNI